MLRFYFCIFREGGVLKKTTKHEISGPQSLPPRIIRTDEGNKGGELEFIPLSWARAARTLSTLSAPLLFSGY